MNSEIESTDKQTEIPDPSPVSSTNRIISGFWRRILAFILDGFILGLVGFVLGLILSDFFALLGVWGILFGFSVAMLYFGILNSSIGGGQTIGKRLLRIEVVERKGNHISLVRSFFRYTVLGSPFFLVQALFPASVMMSPAGYLIKFVIFGFGGAIVYLYIFNRRTRQSLHDLLAGTFVVRTTDGGIVYTPVWKPHLIIVFVWFLIVIFLSVSMPSHYYGGVHPKLLMLQEKIQSSDKVYTATIFSGEKRRITYLNSNVILKERPQDYKAAASEIASMIMEYYPDVMDKALLSITVTYGFDIGIANKWKSFNFRYSPEEWQEILAATPIEE